MALVRILWRLLRRRLPRRMLVWLVVRAIRVLGWRRGVELLVRGGVRWRVLVVGVWRAALRLAQVRAPSPRRRWART